MSYKVTIKSSNNKIISKFHLWRNIISCRGEDSDKCAHFLDFVNSSNKNVKDVSSTKVINSVGELLSVKYPFKKNI